MEKSKKIKEIYDNYIQKTGENDETGQKIQQIIQEILRAAQQELDREKFEQYRDQIYAIAAVAKQGGFINGFRYAVMLMAECYVGEQDITVEHEQF